jgi:hypothetical protein
VPSSTQRTIRLHRGPPAARGADCRVRLHNKCVYTSARTCCHIVCARGTAALERFVAAQIFEHILTARVLIDGCARANLEQMCTGV